MGSKGPSLAVRHDRSLHVEPLFPPIIIPNRHGSQRDRLPRRTFDEAETAEILDGP
jgi:hypothetical protein